MKAYFSYRMQTLAGTAFIAMSLCCSHVRAQESDPRAGLKPGMDDAGIAIKGLEHVTQIKMPPAFLPEQEAAAEPGQNTKQGGKSPGLNFANTDMGFSRNRLVVGNLHGFNVYDIADPTNPKHLVGVVCPAGQIDVSIYHDLVFSSVESKVARIDCGIGETTSEVDLARFRGIRIFDISHPEVPRQVAAVQTCQGSHTLTLVPDLKDKNTLYIYNSGNAGAVRPNIPKMMRPAAELKGCSGESPDEDPNTSLYSIDVIKVPLDAPEKAAVIGRPRIFADLKSGRLGGIPEKTRPLRVGRTPLKPNACHDITVYPEIGLAGGACLGAGLLLDITNPAIPVRLDFAVDSNFAAWHSATFSNDGKKIIFTDESTFSRCQPEDPPLWGGDSIYTIENKKLVRRGYFHVPLVQPNTGNCTAHNGGLIPVPGRDILVQGWYQGGISIIDFTNPDKPFEIAYFDRGPMGNDRVGVVHYDATVVSGEWAAYWYNGYIYGTDIYRGVDILKLKPTEYLTENEIAAAEAVHEDESNPQTQIRIHWPLKPVVARAYLDQLAREKLISANRRAEIEAALAMIDSGKLKHGAFAKLALSLKDDARKASTENATRFNGISEVLTNWTAG